MFSCLHVIPVGLYYYSQINVPMRKLLNVERHLAFRDFLRQHADDAKKYCELKEMLADRFPKDIEAYMDGKDDFIKNLEQKAIQWCGEKL